MKTKTISIIIIAIIVIVIAWYAYNSYKKSLDQETKNGEGSNPSSTPEKTTTGNQETFPKPTKISSPAINKILYTSLQSSGSLPLSKGQKNRQVYLLQFILNALFSAGLTMDGDFGTKTQTALSTYAGKYYADKALIVLLDREMRTNQKKIKNYSFYRESFDKFRIV